MAEVASHSSRAPGHASKMEVERNFRKFESDAVARYPELKELFDAKRLEIAKSQPPKIDFNTLSLEEIYNHHIDHPGRPLPPPAPELTMPEIKGNPLTAEERAEKHIQGMVERRMAARASPWVSPGPISEISHVKAKEWPAYFAKNASLKNTKDLVYRAGHRYFEKHCMHPQGKVHFHILGGLVLVSFFGNVKPEMMRHTGWKIKHSL